MMDETNKGKFLLNTRLIRIEFVDATFIASAALNCMICYNCEHGVTSIDEITLMI